jgi:hypothetical protein
MRRIARDLRLEAEIPRTDAGRRAGRAGRGYD